MVRKSQKNRRSPAAALVQFRDNRDLVGGIVDTSREGGTTSSRVDVYLRRIVRGQNCLVIQCHLIRILTQVLRGDSQQNLIVTIRIGVMITRLLAGRRVLMLPLPRFAQPSS